MGWRMVNGKEDYTGTSSQPRVNNRRFAMGQTVQTLMAAVDRRLHLLDIEEGETMEDMTADTFRVSDRRELGKQGFQLEQVLKDLADLKNSAKDEIATSRQFMAAHEARLRALEDSRFTLVHEARIRALEDSRLTLHTQIENTIQTSRVWLLLLSAVGSAFVSIAIKLFWK
jgi:hypothetical protein